MRHFALVALLLLPLGLGIYFFLHRNEAKTVEVKTSKFRGTAEITSSSLSGTAGKRLFVYLESRATLDDTEVTWPSRYFWLDSFEKDATGRVDAEGLLIVLNTKPNSSADLREQLVIPITDDAQKRYDALLEATRDHSHVRAARAVLAGGESLERAESCRLDGGVSFHVAAARPEDSANIDCSSAEAHFAEDRVSSLVIPETFAFRKSDWRITGFDLRASARDQHITVARDFHFSESATDGSSEPPFELRSKGPVTYSPSSIADTAELDVFSLLDARAGKLVATGGVRFGTPTQHIESSTITTTFDATSGTTGAPRISHIDADGNVDLVLDRGRIRGARATIALLDDGDFDAKVYGPPVTIELRSAASSDSLTTATCSGTFEVHRRAMTPDTPFLVMTMTRDVVISSKEFFGDVDARGRFARFEFARVPKPTGDGFELRLNRLTLDGITTCRFGLQSAKVDGDSLIISGERLDAHRILETGGTSGRLVVAGPARIESPTGTASTDTIALAARRTITLEGSPRGELRLQAEDETHLTLTDGLGSRALHARRADCTVRRSDRTNRWELVEGRFEDDVVADLETGWTVRGMLLTLDGTKRRLTLEGMPATLSTAPEGAGDRLSANAFVFDDLQRTLVATGAVSGSVEMDDFVPSFRSTGDVSAPSPFNQVPLAHPVTWVVGGDRLNVTLQPPSKDSGKATSLRVQEFKLTGSAKMSTPTKRLDADELVWSFVTATGRATGRPLVIEFAHEDSTPLPPDRLECETLVLSRDSSLLQGHPKVRATLLKESSKAPAGSPVFDPQTLDASCERDILIKDAMIYFSGRAVLTHGDPGADGVRVEADTAIIRLLRDASGFVMTKLERIEGFENVRFRSGQLDGSGDMLDFDYLRKEVMVRGRRNKCRLSFGALSQESASVLRFDLANSRLVMFDAEGTGVLKK